MRDRTLASKGEELVEAIVADANAVSHSYSIQLLMSKSGRVGSRIFICFQEKTGTSFGLLVGSAVSDLLSVCKNV